MPSLTDLEERLASPDGHQIRDQLMRELASLELGLRRSKMLPREEYRVVSRLADAAQAAQEVLGTWPMTAVRFLQPNGPATVQCPKS